MTNTSHGSPSDLHGAPGAADPNGSPESGQQGHGNESDPLLDRIGQLIDQRLTQFTQSTLNKAISTHVKRLGIVPQQPASPIHTGHGSEQESDSDQEPAAASIRSGSGQDSETRRQAATVAKLQKQLEKLQRESAEKEERARKAERDSALRRLIEGANVADVEAVFRYAIPDMKVDAASGDYYAEVDGEVLSPQEFVQRVVQSNRLFQRPSMKQGAGSLGEPAHGAAPGGRSMSRKDMETAVDAAIARGDFETVKRLQSEAGSGRLRIV